MSNQIIATRNRSVRQRSSRGMLAVVVLVLTSALAAAQSSDPKETAVAQQPSNAQTPSTPAQESPAQKYFTDVVLVNQNGEKMRFYSDLIQGKVVIINSFFATCQGSCLPISRNLEKVQEALGDRVGKDVRIISISVDPTVDTPQALKAYAKKLNAGPGWYFLTGEKENVEFALMKLGQFTRQAGPSNIIIIGNERTGVEKGFRLAQSDELVKVVESVINDQPAGSKQKFGNANC